jgi:hypothetical protein
MKPRHATALEARLLVELVAKVKSLNTSVALGSAKKMDLKCPCGRVILPPTLVIPALQDRQRGLLKSRIESHLRSKHELSEHTTRLVLKQAFASD